MTVPRGGATIHDLYSVREYVERLAVRTVAQCRGDPDLAEQLIARHIQQVRDDLLKQFA